MNTFDRYNQINRIVELVKDIGLESKITIEEYDINKTYFSNGECIIWRNMEEYIEKLEKIKLSKNKDI